MAQKMADEDGILEIARKTVSEGPICDHCLGRQFANLSTGMSNDERGRAVRIMLSMQRNEALALDHGKDCWVCNGLFTELDVWAERAVQELESVDFDTFLVGTMITGLLAENEEVLWTLSGTTFAELLKSELNREVGKRICSITKKEVEFKRPDVVVIMDIEREQVRLDINSLFIYGRYRKLERGIPQTRWPCRECRGKGCEKCNYTGKQYSESVEELIRSSVLDFFKGEDMILHGAGREDIDARMLGSGRPFVMEIISPLIRHADLVEVVSRINEDNKGRVEVLDARYADKEVVRHIKSTESDKVYNISATFKSKVNKEKLKSTLRALSGIIIRQQTPTRVMHRRADLQRNRKIHEAALISFDDITGTQAVIQLRCEGGLYVKEFVNGDMGRTEPSISSLLGIDAAVKELDVIEVSMDLTGERQWQGLEANAGKRDTN